MTLFDFSKTEKKLVLVDGWRDVSSLPFSSLGGFCREHHLTPHPTNSQTLLLIQTHEEPECIPGVTLDELRVSLIEIDKMLQQWSNKPPIVWKRDLGEEILNGLTANQRSLARSKEGVPITSLGDAQVKRIQSLLINFYVDLKAEALKLSYFSISPSAKLEKRPTSRQPIYGVSERAKFLPFAREPVSIPAAAKKPKYANTESTVASFCNALSSRYKCTITIEDCLQEKPLSYFGVEFTNPSSALRALSQLYGISVSQNQQGVFRLQRSRINRPKALTDLYPAIFSAIPAPVFRYFYDKSSQNEARLSRPDASISNTESFQKLFTDTHERSTFCLQQVIKDAEQWIAQKKTNAVFDDFSRYTKTCYGLAESADFFASLKRLVQNPIPVYITQFDELRVNCAEDKRNTYLNFTLASSGAHPNFVTGMYFAKESKADAARRRQLRAR